VAKYRKVTVVSDACCRIPNAHVKGRIGKGKAACGYAILDDQGNVIDKGGTFLGEMTVPEAEYRGLIQALDVASGFCRDEADVFLDSEFVVRQVTGVYGAKAFIVFESEEAARGAAEMAKNAPRPDSVTFDSIEVREVVAQV
jgi:ribonuclease HI